MFKLVSTYILLLFATVAWSQDSLGTDSSAVDALALPPLDSLVASALKNAPTVKAASAILGQRDADLALARRNWSQRLYSDAGLVNVNTTGNLLIANTDGEGNVIGGDNSISIVSGNTYRAGVAARISLYDIYARPKEIEKAKMQREESEYGVLAAEQEIQKTVTDLYIQLKMVRKMVELQQTTVATFSAQYEMAEREFRQGDVAITELARMTEMKAKSELSLEQTKSNYENLYKQMEILIGRKLNSYN
ncbi:MAG: TolC family protein [Bacteroidia bacterium]